MPYEPWDSSVRLVPKANRIAKTQRQRKTAQLHPQCPPPTDYPLPIRSAYCFKLRFQSPNPDIRRERPRTFLLARALLFGLLQSPVLASSIIHNPFGALRGKVVSGLVVEAAANGEPTVSFPLGRDPMEKEDFFEGQLAVDVAHFLDFRVSGRIFVVFVVIVVFVHLRVTGQRENFIRGLWAKKKRY